MIGMLYGLWLHYLYKEGGWELMATEWWKGLGVALLVWGALMASDHVWRRLLAFIKTGAS